MAPDLVQQPTAGTPVTVVLGNRELSFILSVDMVLRRANKDVNFRFRSASRVAEFIELATRPETKLALFVPPGNLEPDLGASCATPGEEAVRIVRAVKAKTAIPVIVMAVQTDARKAVLDAGASEFLDLVAGPQQLVDAVGKCLGLAPKEIVRP